MNRTKIFSRFMLTPDRRRLILVVPRPPRVRAGKGRSHDQHPRGFLSRARRCGPSLCQPCAATAAGP